MWSFGDDDSAKAALSEHISNTPAIVYPFVIIGPSLLYIGLALHAANFIKKNTLSALMVIAGAPAVGVSFFVVKNGICMVISCLVFALGLLLLLNRKEADKTIA
jgi:membrane-bound ClpP family serine protease